MTITIESVLTAIDAAHTAGAALDAIPEDWRVFVTGPDEGDFACSILPEGIKSAPGRIYERGLAMGRGDCRLAAMRGAVEWLRVRIPADVRNGAAAA